ncbi:MAG: hypothetical protein JOY96_05775 [Verrucomicrobia bacterium]|nr:hypothetical protein [Verrucomicrobiota bacterium]
MIALKDSLPLLRAGDQLFSIRDNWLQKCLERAAILAGYNRWWLSVHVTTAILCYLSSEYEGTVVTLKQIEEIIRSVLLAIGYSEIASRFEMFSPPFELSLPKLAEEAGPGYELAFFSLLKQRMEPALSKRASSLEISGLRPCVRSLQSVKTWSTNCTTLCTEIVQFVRHEVELRINSDLFVTIR